MDSRLGKILLATGGGLSRVTGRAGHQDHGNLPTEGGKMQDTESRNVIVVAKFCTANKCQQRGFEVWVGCSPRGTKSWPSPALTAGGNQGVKDAWILPASNYR